MWSLGAGLYPQWEFLESLTEEQDKSLSEVSAGGQQLFPFLFYLDKPGVCFAYIFFWALEMKFFVCFPPAPYYEIKLILKQ